MEQKYAPSSSVREKITPCWEKGSTFPLCYFLSVLCLVRLFEKWEAMAGRDGVRESRLAPQRLTDISDLLLSCTSNISTAGGDNQIDQPQYHLTFSGAN